MKRTLSPASVLDNVVDLYIRVSSTEQAEEGYSVGEQEARLRNYSAAMGYTIHAVHVDPGFSGASLHRPGIQRVIEDVNNGSCKKVIVWKLDRLSRSQKDTLILLEDVFLANDCHFISLMESFDTSTPFGRCIVGILAAFAQMERENIKLRTTMGRQARIRAGHFHGSHAPIGYKFERTADGTLLSNDLVVDPYASILIKEVYQLFLSGKSLNQISQYMASTYGSQLYDWGHNTAVRRVLANPVYCGKVKAGKEWFPGIHEALVSESDWYMAAALLEHNRAINKRTYTYRNPDGYFSDNLLTGLLYCGDCGARMYARKVSSKKKKYICHSVARTAPAMIKSDHCTNRLHPFTVEQLDALVLGEVEKLALDRSYFDSLTSSEAPAPDNDSEVFKDRLAEVQRQIDRLLNLYQTGLVDLPAISSRLGDLNREKEQLEINIESLSHQNYIDLKEAAWETVSDFPAVLESGDMESVHRIIHTLIDKVVVLNTDVTIYWSFC